MFFQQPESDYDSAWDEEEFHSRESARSSDELEDATTPGHWGRRVPTSTVPGHFVAAGHPVSYHTRTLHHPTFEAYYAAVAALQKAETPQMQIRREQGFFVNSGEYFYTDPLQPPGHRVYNCLSPPTYNMFGSFRLVTPPPIMSPGIFVPSLEALQRPAGQEDSSPAAGRRPSESPEPGVSGESTWCNLDQSICASDEGVDVRTPKNLDCTLDRCISGSGRSLPGSACTSGSGRSFLESLGTAESEASLLESVSATESGRSLVESVCPSDSKDRLLESVGSAERGRSFFESVCPSESTDSLFESVGTGRSLIESVCPSESRDSLLESVGTLRSLLESVCPSESRDSLLESVCTTESRRSLLESVCPSESRDSLIESVCTAGSGRSLLESLCATESGRSLLESACTAESGRRLLESVCTTVSGRSLLESVCTAGSGRSLLESVCATESGRSLVESVMYRGNPYTQCELEAVSGLLHLSCSYPSSVGQ
ncbi:histone deacetylase complex subunit SAP25 [Mantella aurantiaca]